MLIPIGFFGGAAAGDYELIETVYGNATFGSVTFSSIPQTYKHLQIRMTIRSSASPASMGMRTNGNAGGYDYHWHSMHGNGTETTGSNYATSYMFLGWAPGGGESVTFGHSIIELNDYTATKYKTIKSITGWTAFRTGMWTGFNYVNTSPITSINIFDAAGGVLRTGSRISLYGIKG